MDTGERVTPESRQMKFLVDAQLASAFKSACKKAGVSMSGDLTAHMVEYMHAGKTVHGNVFLPEFGREFFLMYGRENFS